MRLAWKAVGTRVMRWGETVDRLVFLPQTLVPAPDTCLAYWQRKTRRHRTSGVWGNLRESQLPRDHCDLPKWEPRASISTSGMCAPLYGSACWRHVCHHSCWNLWWDLKRASFRTQRALPFWKGELGFYSPNESLGGSFLEVLSLLTCFCQILVWKRPL